MLSRIKNSAVKGMMWVSISQGVQQFIRFAVNLVLARLLIPEDFGLMTMASLFTGVILTFNELGLSAGIVQRKTLEDRHINSSFWASVASGFMFCLLTIFSAPYVASFFKDQRLETILYMLSPIFILGGFMIIPRALMVRDLDFRSIGLIEISVEFASSLLSVVLALSGFSFWSLVWKNIIGNILLVAAYFIVNPWRPIFRFDYPAFKEIFTFSGNVLGSNIISYAQTNIDYLLVGKVFGSRDLGMYTMAVQMTTFPLKRVSSVIADVLFPVFSRMQEDNDKLQKGYTKTTRLVSIITFPAVAGLFMVSPEFVKVAFGDKWAPIVPLLSIFCLSGAVRSVTVLANSIFLSKGKADTAFRLNTLALVVSAVGIILAAPFGVTGIAVAVTSISIVMYSIMQLLANRIISLSLKDYLSSIFPALSASLLMMASVYAFKSADGFISLLSPAEVLAGSIFIGVISYVVFLNTIYRDLKIEIKDVLIIIAAKR